MSHRKAFKVACRAYAKQNNLTIPNGFALNDAYGPAARDLTQRIQERNRIKPDGNMTPETLLVVGRYLPAVTLGGRAYWAMRCVEGPLEVWGNNLGPYVQQIQRLGSELAPGSWPWCAATTSWAYRCAGWSSWAAFVKSHHEAWVPDWVRAAQTKRYGMSVVDWRRGRQGDAACWKWTQPVHQHIGLLGARPNQLTGVASTIEGNTSGSSSGSQDDGGGLWRRSRDVRPPHVVIRIV